MSGQAGSDDESVLSLSDSDAPRRTIAPPGDADDRLLDHLEKVGVERSIGKGLLDYAVDTPERGTYWVDGVKRRAFWRTAAALKKKWERTQQQRQQAAGHVQAVQRATGQVQAALHSLTASSTAAAAAPASAVPLTNPVADALAELRQKQSWDRLLAPDRSRDLRLSPMDHSCDLGRPGAEAAQQTLESHDSIRKRISELLPIHALPVQMLDHPEMMLHYFCPDDVTLMEARRGMLSPGNQQKRVFIMAAASSKLAALAEVNPITKQRIMQAIKKLPERVPDGEREGPPRARPFEPFKPDWLGIGTAFVRMDACEKLAALHGRIRQLEDRNGSLIADMNAERASLETLYGSLGKSAEAYGGLQKENTELRKNLGGLQKENAELKKKLVDAEADLAAFKLDIHNALGEQTTRKRVRSQQS